MEKNIKDYMKSEIEKVKQKLEVAVKEIEESKLLIENIIKKTR